MIHTLATGETVYEQGGCKGVRLFESHGNEYVHLLIEPDGSIPAHSLPMPVTFCVLKGCGICTVGEDSFSVSAGDLLESPPEALRGWENIASEMLEVLVIKRSAGL